MKTWIKRIAVSAMVVCMFTMGGCGLLKKEEGTVMTKGDFKYCYIKEANAAKMYKDADFIAILEVSYQGKNKQTLRIPEEIDGKKVIQIGMYVQTGIGSNEYILSTPDSKFNKVILPKTIRAIVAAYGAVGVPKFIFKDTDTLETIKFPRQSYLSQPLYKRFKAENESWVNAKMANVEYLTNGEIYFVDDYDSGELIEAPPEPTKDGHKFAGWYTEEEYKNEWNFKTDKFYLNENQTVKSFYAKFEN